MSTIEIEKLDPADWADLEDEIHEIDVKIEYQVDRHGDTSWSVRKVTLYFKNNSVPLDDVPFVDVMELSRAFQTERFEQMVLERITEDHASANIDRAYEEGRDREMEGL